MSALHLQLTQKDATEAEHERVIPHEVMVSIFLQLEIELEDQI